MENKRNEATLSRPEGDRVIDAPYVFINTPEFIHQLMEEEAWQKNDRNAITVYKTSNMTMVLVCLHAKAVLKDNLVDGIFTIQVIEGVIKVSIPDGSVDMMPHQVITNAQKHDQFTVSIQDRIE